MLQIRLRNKGTSAEGGGAAKLSSGETVTVACPDHLVLAELPVAKSLGSAGSVSHVKIVGRRTRRSLGERVHFCVRCDYPIAIYGRLSPCEHAFCLDCARSDSICYLCDERVQKIQTIKMMEGIFICAAPHCLKSFLKKSDFESHIRTIHADLLRPSIHRDGNDSEAASAKRPSASESTVQAPPRPAPSSSSNSQAHNREDRVHRPQVPQELQPPLRPAIQPRPPPLQPPFVGQIPNHPSDQQTESRPPGFDGAEAVNNFPQQVYVVPQQGIQSETPYHDYQAAPNFAVPVNPNFLMVSPSFGYPPGQEQGSLLGFPPGFAETHPQQWTGAPFDSSSVMGNRGTGDNSTMNLSDSQGRTVGVFYQGPMQGDSRDGKGILAPQPPLPPPPPPPPLMAPHMPQMQGGNYFSPGDQGHSGQGFRWQHDKRDNFGSGQD